MLVNEYEPEFQIQEEFKKWKYINECVPICYKQNRRGRGTGHYVLNSTSHWSGDLTSWHCISLEYVQPYPYVQLTGRHF